MFPQEFRARRNLQDAVIAAIHNSTYHFALPILQTNFWGPSFSQDERERLEFVGDGVIYAALSLELRSRYSLATPYIYTMIRRCLTSNITFEHLMNKTDTFIFSENPFGTGQKSAADALEAIMAQYCCESGFSAFQVWVNAMFVPLISAARRALEDFHREHLVSSPLIATAHTMSALGRHRKPMSLKTSQKQLSALMRAQSVIPVEQAGFTIDLTGISDTEGHDFADDEDDGDDIINNSRDEQSEGQSPAVPSSVSYVPPVIVPPFSSASALSTNGSPCRPFLHPPSLISRPNEVSGSEGWIPGPTDSPPGSSDNPICILSDEDDNDNEEDSDGRSLMIIN